MSRCLIVEDNPSLARVYAEYLAQAGYVAQIVETGQAALEELERRQHQLALLDLQLPDLDGMEVLRRVREQGLNTTVVVVTAHGSINTAVEAMRQGASDFLVKPVSPDRLRVTVANALDRRRLDDIVNRFHDDDDERFFGFIGSSPAMQTVYRTVEAASGSKATVFITGESGTGKEVCALAVHASGARRDRAFVAINCAAIPRDLIESELFGHVKGAFTGAVIDREGAAMRARGGTLFLDEICEMSPEMQTKLLRFLQTGRVQRVGSTADEPVDVRIVCATNRDPSEEVRAGRFREDLFYRLHVIPIHLPPLRERGEDVVDIARHFLKLYAEEEGKRFADFDEEALARLKAYGWPGNVRQLQNVVRNIVVLNDGARVGEAMLPPPLAAGPAPEGPTAENGPGAPVPATVANGHAVPANGSAFDVRPLWLVEKEAIERTIAHFGGNIVRAAAALEISASTIYRKKQAWEERLAADRTAADSA